MPKDCLPENSKSPLRVLRTMLGLTQKTFSERTDIPTDTISSLENGRSSTISNQTLDKISMAFGGTWDGERWIIGSRRTRAPGPVPLTRAFAEGYRQMLEAPPTEEQEKAEVDLIGLRTFELFAGIPKRHWSKLIVRFTEFLEEARADLAPNDPRLKVVFSLTQPRPVLNVDPKTQQTVSVQRLYSGESRSLLRDYRKQPPIQGDYNVKHLPGKKPIDMQKHTEILALLLKVR